MAKARGGWHPIFVLALLLLAALPSGSAQGASGGFRLLGPLSLPSESHADFSAGVEALYAGETSDADLTLASPILRVRYFEARVIRVPGIIGLEASLTEASWGLTNATIRVLRGSHADNAGRAGVYPDRETCAVAFTDKVDVESRQVSRIPAEHQTVPDAPDRPHYQREITTPHLYLTTPGIATCEGSGALKVWGFDLRIEAEENATEWRTGREEPSPAEVVLRWFHFEFGHATFTLSSPNEPIEVATREASLAWDGEARMRPLAGGLVTDDAEYRAAGDDARASLTGSFAGALAPAPDAADALDLTGLRGDLRATSLVRHDRAPAPLVSASWGPARDWLPWTLVGLAIAGGGAAILVARRHGAHALLHAPQDAEASLPELESFFGHYVQLANERQDHELALAWIVAAREAGVDTAQVSMWEATIHKHRGDDERALSLYEDASGLDPLDAEADYWAAVLLAQRGGRLDGERALEHLKAALRRQPGLAEVVRGDPLFATLPPEALEAVIEEAFARVDPEQA